MTTIYDKEGVTVTLYDDDDVTIELEGRHVITMTAQEFGDIAREWVVKTMGGG